MNNPVTWFEIYVADMARACRFYEAMLGVRFSAAPPIDGMDMEMMFFPMEMTNYGVGGALVKMAGFAPSVGGTLVYFHCEDCAVEAERAVKAGGQLVKPKFAIGPFGFIALVSDSEGNMIGLHSPPKQA